MVLSIVCKTLFRWKCADRRYLIKEKSSNSDPLEKLSGQCGWYKNYTTVPADLECVLSYCDNATDAPNSNGANYNFLWDENLVNLSHSLVYPCMDGMSVENDTDTKEEASVSSTVICGDAGEFVYPDIWPQCSDSITCADPGNSTEVNRKYENGSDLEYLSVLFYDCNDTRKWIKLADDTTLAPNITTQCKWRKTYTIDGTSLECEIHHCRHPHDDHGAHDPPPEENNITLVDRGHWTVPFEHNIAYECDANTFFEDDEIDPIHFRLEVECIKDLGVYDTPVRNKQNWPNCTETVVCGQPPETSVNGTITWLNGTEFQETYDTYVKYKCQNGSQFDTDKDKKGDSISVTTRCQWNKKWAPYAALPECIVTHCVEPFEIPDETFLEEVTSNWTEINEFKQYRCKGMKEDGTHTRFWETDRAKSTFEFFCNPSGYFTYEEWPICLEGNQNIVEILK